MTRACTSFQDLTEVFDRGQKREHYLQGWHMTQIRSVLKVLQSKESEKNRERPRVISQPSNSRQLTGQEMVVCSLLYAKHQARRIRVHPSSTTTT